jgi:hypothetical protein
MHGNTDTLDHRRQSPLSALAARLPGAAEPADTGEESCAAFGFLRGLHDRGLMVEFRFRDGNTHSFPYSWLGPVQFNPSVGLLLKFAGDVVTLVLIRGSNLDTVVRDRGVNLTDRGLLRHRITWVREMDEDELRRADKGEATIDRIEVGQFEVSDEQRKWLETHARAFIRERGATG